VSYQVVTIPEGQNGQVGTVQPMRRLVWRINGAIGQGVGMGKGRKPTADEAAGMASFNAMTEAQRASALKAAATALNLVKSWKHHKRVERQIVLAAKELAKGSLK
jgi:hypothetical protein